MMMAALQAAQAATSASSLRGLLSRRETRAASKNLRHQNRLKNNRKIVARRTRAPHPCHQRCDNNKIVQSSQLFRMWSGVEIPRLKSLMYRAYIVIVAPLVARMRRARSPRHDFAVIF
jgi:hypothetical protein